jgi:hypothetical protein
MSISSINNFSNNNLASELSSALQGTGLTITTSGNNVGSVGQGSDSSQLSPFAQLLSTLQQLQQSNPTQYATVMQQISTNLQTAAQTATKDGNTSAASELTQLSTDFANASKTGQLPNIQDLAQALGGGGHHHHHFHADSSSTSSSSASGSSSSNSTSGTDNTGSSTSQALEQLLSAFQASNNSQNSALNPMAIIMNALSSAGITPTAS